MLKRCWIGSFGHLLTAAVLSSSLYFAHFFMESDFSSPNYFRNYFSNLLKAIIQSTDRL